MQCEQMMQQLDERQAALEAAEEQLVKDQAGLKVTQELQSSRDESFVEREGMHVQLPQCLSSHCQDADPVMSNVCLVSSLLSRYIHMQCI